MSNTLSRLWSRWRGSPQAEGVNELPVRVKGTEFTRTRAAPVRVTGVDQALVGVQVGVVPADQPAAAAQVVSATEPSAATVATAAVVVLKAVLFAVMVTTPAALQAPFWVTLLGAV